MWMRFGGTLRVIGFVLFVSTMRVSSLPPLCFVWVCRRALTLSLSLALICFTSRNGRNMHCSCIIAAPFFRRLVHKRSYKLTSFEDSDVGVTRSRTTPPLLPLLLALPFKPFAPVAPKLRDKPRCSAATPDEDDVGYVGTSGCETGVKPVPPSMRLSKLNMTPFDGVEIETPAMSAMFLHCDGVMANGTASELGRFGRCAGIVGVFRVVGVSQPASDDELMMGLWCMESSMRLADGGPSSRSSLSGVSSALASDDPSSELALMVRSSCGSTLMCSTLIFSSGSSMGRGIWTLMVLLRVDGIAGLVVMT